PHSPPTSSRSASPSRRLQRFRASRASSRSSCAAQSVDDAMAAVRAIDTEDEYAFFNSVHLHRWRARSLRIDGAAPAAVVAPATRCPGMEMALGTLNSFAHWLEPATLLASVGSGGEAVVQHWAELVQRSQTQAARWRVVTDNGVVLENHGAQL